MPTQTFFRLPEEKQETLLRAARAEFSRVSYAEASINKIVQAAGVSRGSFYLYFADKADLFRHLLMKYRTGLAEQLAGQLRANGGDLFAAFLGGFDLAREAAESGRQDPSFVQMMELVRRNAGLSPDLFCCLDSRRELDHLIALVDLDRLDLTSPEDLTDLFSLLLNVTGPALAALLSGGDPDKLRRQYQNKLRLIQCGAATGRRQKKT